MLTWFAQKRMVFAFAVPGNGINQALASEATPERFKRIEQEAKASIFGNVVNFPFYPAREVWPMTPMSIDTSNPVQTGIRTLFISGDLDCRTPAEQVEHTMEGFTNATHLIVENAGHEQAMWELDIFDHAIPDFLLGNDVSDIQAFYNDIRFIPVKGNTKGHPSLK